MTASTYCGFSSSRFSLRWCVQIYSLSTNICSDKISLSVNKKTDSGKLPKGIYFYNMVKKFEIEIPGKEKEIIQQNFDGIVEKKNKEYRAIGNSYWRVSAPDGVSEKSKEN